SLFLLSLFFTISSFKLKTQDGKSTGNFYTNCRCCDGKLGLFCYLDIAKYNKNNSSGMFTICGTPDSRPSITASIDFDVETGEIETVHIKPICNTTMTEDPK
ncbi:hypothetical protein PENTCL1PPCAC_18132, partial [Pristionchus entomophagus]